MDNNCRGSGRKAARHPTFKAVNTVLGNIKSGIGATFRSGSKKHAPRRPTELEHPSTAAKIFPAMVPRPGSVGRGTLPTLHLLMKLAENYT